MKTNGTSQSRLAELGHASGATVLSLAQILLIAAAAQTSASAQSPVFVPGNASGYFGNFADIMVPLVPAVSVSWPATIEVAYVSGTVTDADDINTGPNGVTWNWTVGQSPLEETVGIAGGTTNDLDALIGVFVPATTLNDPSGFNAFDGTKNVTPVGIVPSSLVFIGEGKTFDISEAGTLFLGINDYFVSDNGGGFNVSVKVTPMPYNAATQFSATANPSGAWNYGWSQSLGSAFFQDKKNVDLKGVNGWTSACCGATQPDIIHNPSDETIKLAGSDPVPAGALALRPGSKGQNAVLRWTAPADGQYTLKAAFSGLDSTGPTKAKVAILLNAIKLYSSSVDGHGPLVSHSFSGTVSMLTGDTLDFTVAPDAGSNYLHDTNSLSVVITPIE